MYMIYLLEHCESFQACDYLHSRLRHYSAIASLSLRGLLVQCLFQPCYVYDCTLILLQSFRYSVCEEAG